MRIYEAIRRPVLMYLDHHVSRASAALSYFLMLTIFPLLICLYYILGSLFPSTGELRELLGILLPGGTMETITEFLNYISLNADKRMLSFAIAAMATSSAAAYRIVDKLMLELRARKRKEKVMAFLFSFVFSVIFLITLYVAALILATGGWFISFADRYLPFVDISEHWEWLRFLLLFFMLFVLIAGLYRITARAGKNELVAHGALCAAAAIVFVSMLFSWFIGMSARYPIVYGSLASVIITLLWLYICCNILFIGNIVNICLEDMDK